MDMSLKEKAKKIFDPLMWGLRLKAINDLSKGLKSFWERYSFFFKTKTSDNRHYGYKYISCLLRMESDRNYASIGRESGVNKQNMQHFMSNSPWEFQETYTQIQQEIRETKGLSKGGALLLDESADEKAGNRSAGAGRQYNGRLGKVDMSQVGVFLAYANIKPYPLWTWVDGDLFLQEHWFTEEMEPERKQRVFSASVHEFLSSVGLESVIQK